MSELAGNLIVVAVLMVMVGFAVRSLWKARKKGGCCGDCGCCGESCRAGESAKSP